MKTSMGCLFCDFITGKRKTHVNGFPFQTLWQTKYSISFLCINLPLHEDAHIIVTPKKHIEKFEDVRNDIAQDFIHHAQNCETA